MAEPTSSDPAGSRVFVSYASAELVRVRGLVATLERAGVSAWIDRAGIPGGANYGPEIVAAIRNSRAVLLCCSVAAFASRNVRQEVALAWKLERPVLPLLLQPAAVPDDLAYWLEAAQWIEVLDRAEDDWLPEVLRALRRLDIAGAATPFPAAPARSPTAAAMLPAPLTALLGRDADVREVAALLAGHRLVTLTGPGGVGKTRLAIGAAQAAASEFPDGVRFVALEAVVDPKLVAPAVAQVLGVRESGAEPLEARLKTLLRGQRLLLVVDNVEQLVEAAPLLADLLAVCPSLAVLATSRVRLRLSGEREYAVAPLALPLETEPAGPERTGQAGAVRLFVERARAVRTDFALTTENAEAVAGICRRLDGLPLAIELAAARVKVLPPVALLARLKQQLPILTGGGRDLPARQQTMRDAVAWSHALLTDAERTLFRRLAVFVGGFSLEAAVDVVGGSEIDVIDGVASLADNSLLREEDDPSGAPRYRFLETVREFGLEQLAASGEQEDARRAHAAWCLALAEAANPPRSFFLGVVGLDRLAVEHDNLRAALVWLEAEGDAEGLLRLAVGMAGLWMWRSHRPEGGHWLGRGLEHGGEVSWSVRARAQIAAGVFAHYDGDAERGVALITQSLSLRRAGDDAWGAAHSHFFLGLLAIEGGEYDRAAQHVGQAFAAFSALGDSPWVAMTRHQLGVIAFACGALEEATTHLSEALARNREQGNAFGTAMALDFLGLVASSNGDPVTAANCHRESLAIWLAIGSKERLAEWLARVATLESASGQAKQAVRLAAAAEALRDALGTIRVPPERGVYEHTAEKLRADLGEAGFLASWAAGQALSPEEAVAEGETALGVVLQVNPAAESAPVPSSA